MRDYHTLHLDTDQCNGTVLVLMFCVVGTCFVDNIPNCVGMIIQLNIFHCQIEHKFYNMHNIFSSIIQT